MAYIYYTITGSTAATLLIKGLDTDYGGLTRTYTWYVNGTSYATGTLPSGAAHSPAVNITVPSGGTYPVYVTGIYYTGSTPHSFTLPTVYISPSNSTRPGYFCFTYAKTSGAAFRLTEYEWNDLTGSINDLRAYKGLSPYGFTAAANGNSFTAAMYNQAVTAVYGITGSLGSLSYVYAGEAVPASRLNNLKNEINSIG